MAEIIYCAEVIVPVTSGLDRYKRLLPSQIAILEVAEKDPPVPAMYKDPLYTAKEFMVPDIPLTVSQEVPL